MTSKQERILELTGLVRKDGTWTTYGAIGEIVYGPGKGAQTVGNTMRDHGSADSVHRVLNSSGRISPHWRGAGGSPEDAKTRLLQEGIWDKTHNRARKDRFISAARLRQLESQ
jgi:alkylated DNA nucleotide flippase Atl1